MLKSGFGIVDRDGSFEPDPADGSEDFDVDDGDDDGGGVSFDFANVWN
jgi:hypothetical protein